MTLHTFVVAPADPAIPRREMLAEDAETALRMVIPHDPDGPRQILAEVTCFELGLSWTFCSYMPAPEPRSIKVSWGRVGRT